MAEGVLHWFQQSNAVVTVCTAPSSQGYVEGIRFCEVVKLLFSLLGALHFLPPLLCSSFLLWKNERTPTPKRGETPGLLGPWCEAEGLEYESVTSWGARRSLPARGRVSSSGGSRSASGPFAMCRLFLFFFKMSNKSFLSDWGKNGLCSLEAEVFQIILCLCYKL